MRIQALLVASCVVGGLFALPSDAHAREKTEIKPAPITQTTPNGVQEWSLGRGWEGGNQRPAYLYLIPSGQCGGACPGTVVIYWQSMHGATPPTITSVTLIDHVWRTGLNTYRLDVETGGAPEACVNTDPTCGHTLHRHTLLLDTWARTVQRA